MKQKFRRAVGPYPNTPEDPLGKLPPGAIVEIHDSPMGSDAVVVVTALVVGVVFGVVLGIVVGFVFRGLV
jgi:hypothetical protein